MATVTLQLSIPQNKISLTRSPPRSPRSPTNDTPKSPKNKSIYEDLLNIGIPNDIAQKADQIHHELAADANKRNKQKKFFYCVYHAYIEMGQPHVPKYVAKMVGLPIDEIAKANKMFPPRPFTDISYQQFIPRICDKVGIDPETQAQIMDFSEKFNGQTDIREKLPQVIAAGIITVYLTTHGGEVNYNEFTKATDVGNSAVRGAHKLIADLYNTLG